MITVLLEKLLVVQIVKKLHSVTGTRWLINLFIISEMNQDYSLLAEIPGGGLKIK
jgi:hypothetical protein